MRTTLSLDDDVAAQLEAWRAKEKLGLKEAVNTALRRGLAHVDQKSNKEPFRNPTFDLGECLVPNLDNVWEVLDDEETEWQLKKLGRGPKQEA